MSKEKANMVCRVEYAGGLDNSFRRFFQNPQKILKTYIKSGMTVLDVGCGPGFFSVEIAKMLDGKGKVIAADLQEGMLNIIRKKINGTTLEDRITFHKCEADKIGLTEKVDFAFAFYMVHEVPDKEKFLAEIYSIVKPGGQLYIIEPKFHVTKNAFNNMLERLKKYDFEIVESPKVSLSRTVLLRKKI